MSLYLFLMGELKSVMYATPLGFEEELVVRFGAAAGEVRNMRSPIPPSPLLNVHYLCRSLFGTVIAIITH